MAEDQIIADQVRKIISDTTGKPIEDITPEKTFEQLQCDSLDVVETIIGIEEAFDGITVDEQDFNMSSTVGALIARVESLKNGR